MLDVSYQVRHVLPQVRSSKPNTFDSTGEKEVDYESTWNRRIPSRPSELRREA
jgi:hypothetical protein